MDADTLVGQLYEKTDELNINPPVTVIAPTGMVYLIKEVIYPNPNDNSLVVLLEE